MSRARFLKRILFYALIILSLSFSFYLLGCGEKSTGEEAGSTTDNSEVDDTGEDPAPAPTPSYVPVYVNIVMHNEEPLEGVYPDYVNNEIAFTNARIKLLDLVNKLKAEGVMLNFQSDWNFLMAVEKFDKGAGTGGRNILRYIYDLGFEVDPHAHETLYNYADVAYLIERLGVPPSNTVGGFIMSPEESSIVEYLQNPITGLKYPDYIWEPQILWGGATMQHQDDKWVSGVWRPKDGENPYEDDPSKLPLVGNYTGIEGVGNLLNFSVQAQLDSIKIYTVTISIAMLDLGQLGYIDSIIQEIRNLKDEDSYGILQWVGLKETIDIWKSQYDSQPNLLYFPQ